MKDEIVRSLFNLLNKKNIKYCILRDLDNDIFTNFNVNKDLDIIVSPEDKDMFLACLRNDNWKLERHPWDFGNNFIFLYGMNPFLFFSKNGVKLDVSFQLCCRSVNTIEWVPLDQMIQSNVWSNRVYNKDKKAFFLANKEELIHLITRCVYDKREFPSNYRDRINELMSNVDLNQLKADLQGVFFNFSDECIKLLSEKRFDCIRTEYIRFCLY